MLIFLCLCFLASAYNLSNISVKGSPGFAAVMFVLGSALLPVVILAAAILVWGAEHGRW